MVRSERSVFHQASFFSRNNAADNIEQPCPLSQRVIWIQLETAETIPSSEDRYNLPNVVCFASLVVFTIL